MQSQDGDRGVVRPHRAAVVAERGVAAVRRRHRAQSEPASPGRARRGAGRPTSSSSGSSRPVPSRWPMLLVSESTGRLAPSRARAGNRPSAVAAPERRPEPLRQRRAQSRYALRAGRGRTRPAGRPRASRPRTRTPAPRRARPDRLGDGAVGEPDRVAGVLPALVGQAVTAERRGTRRKPSPSASPSSTIQRSAPSKRGQQRSTSSSGSPERHASCSRQTHSGVASIVP